MPPKYESIIVEIDDLVIEVLRRARANPKFLSTRIGPDAKKALAYQNPQAAAWGLAYLERRERDGG